MKYHVVVGDMAARPLLEAVATEESMQGEVLILKDILNVGPLQKAEGQSFSALRSRFWETVTDQPEGSITVDDLERVLKVSNALHQHADATIWFWMSALPADVCAYYWLLEVLQKWQERFYVVNINGLPFLDEQGKLFFPKSISEVTARELIKARKLARLITPSELEVEGGEWQRMMDDNSGIRVVDGGKRWLPKPITFYDDKIMSLATAQPMKASRLVQQVLQKHAIPTGDTFLGWRIKQMVLAEKISSTSDLSKPLKEIEVRLPNTELFDAPITTNTEDENA